MTRQPGACANWHTLAEPTGDAQGAAQVRSLLAAGLKPRDIAERLGVAPSAVLRVLYG
jgi:hypothetical protein